MPTSTATARIADLADPGIITATVERFGQISWLGRSRIYELIVEGQLDSIKIGKRRLILIESYRRLIARKCAEAAA